MSEPKPNMIPLYGAAYGFNTHRHRVKPVHFATGFFISLFGRKFRNELLNNVVASADGKDHSGNYALENLYQTLQTAGKISSSIGVRELHTLRKHLRCLANNDEAVFPVYSKKPGFGSDYSTASDAMLTSTKDNDGFTGHFVRTILDESPEGKAVLTFARTWMQQHQAPLRQIYQPLLSEDYDEVDSEERYSGKLGELDSKRRKQVAKMMSAQTKALLNLCTNTDSLAASETRLRFLIIGLCVWLFRYLLNEAFSVTQEQFVMFADTCGDRGSRVREQSRWSYARLREALIGVFAAFADSGRFEDCENAWIYMCEHMDGRPDLEQFYGTIALRSGLSQPRGNAIPKHFEPQPDTLRVLVLSVLPSSEGMIPITELLIRLFDTWGLVFGGRPEDAELLGSLGYTGLDQDRDLTPNVEALISLLAELGLATRFSDGLVMCHSRPQFS
jgi:hypothetical protein